MTLVPEVPIIGIDGSRLSVADRTGTETYSAQIIEHIIPLADAVILRVFLRTKDVPPSLQGHPHVESVPIPFPRLWTHARLSWEMLRRPPGVLFVPAHVVPLVHPPTIVTVHDLGYVHHPESHSPSQRLILDLTTRWSVRVARHVIAISNATKRDLIGAYNVAPQDITVIPHGVDPAFRPQNPDAVAAIKSRLRLPERFVLTVGTVHPRKNLVRLAAAMDAVAAAGLPHRLVIAGKSGWLASDVERGIAASDTSGRVTRLGYVSPSDLPGLVAAADAFVLPSLYEGFGLPVLEALASGIPTLVSDRSALPEVAGNAALQVDPMNSAAIGAALVRLLTDDLLRQRLRIAGPKRAAMYSWRTAAESTLAVLRRVIAESPGTDQ